MAREADVLVTMLGYPKDLEKTILCPEHGILNFVKPGMTLIDHSTSSPELAKTIEA